ncbi:Rad3-related DNA helicase [Catenibacillus scindens]|uniref:Rad3-related DNA helicase n=1 Tax=Catenibacillus scindens TaxID=673271 RepID=A0A7W8M3N4_9FIRM|nr:ATP-dependent DNA helicase [Catenibacillus scindens]MBB5263230.1 Rad3-related DNA helicase [Catenibacillus scindens]
MDKVKISVRRLVEFILRSGDIDSGAQSLRDPSVMQEGTAIHKKIQKEGGASYRPEVSMKMDFQMDENLTITLEGRADGIIEDMHIPVGEGDSGYFYTIDEIKGTYASLRRMDEPSPVHMGQALCYAYMYAKSENLPKIGVQVTYVHMESGKIRRFTQERTIDQLQTWIESVLEKYALWVRWALDWKKQRNISIGKQNFPFEYRPGQKRLIAGVYQTIVQGKKLFIQAPTGTGKTISTLFPAIKAMGEGKSDKIFYLTAKTITRTVAEDTFRLLGKRGLEFKYITLTAKEKCCVLEEPRCNPADCPRARGHFDRVNAAVFDMINAEPSMSREVVEAYAQEYMVCPFEMQLDAAVWLDGVVCDYNYVFDPYVYLKRFFSDTKENYILLIDEAHNLVERARDMFSADLKISQFKALRSIVKQEFPKLWARLGKCIKFMSTVALDCPDCTRTNSSGGFTLYLMRMMSEMELILKNNEDKSATRLALKERILEFYLEARRFVNTYDSMDEERYIEYGKPLPDGDFMLKIFCVDPSKDLSLRLDLGLSAVFFSATLLPVQYYKSLLSVSAVTDYDMYADSPFKEENRLLMAATDVSSRYTRRNQEEYEKISDYIRDISRARNGNYLIFFPSYVYMENVFEVFSSRELSKAGHGFEVHVQENSMSEEARQEFLDVFKAKTHSTVLGFCVLGGIFSEGIDLKEDRLIGAVIVGTGLPQVGDERELLREFYDRKCGMGFEYAYLYPGMNKVLQAGGRVIRTEKDRGIIALLDERFNYRQYRGLFPREWSGCVKVCRDTVVETVNAFWEKGIDGKKV